MIHSYVHLIIALTAQSWHRTHFRYGRYFMCILANRVCVCSCI